MRPTRAARALFLLVGGLAALAVLADRVLLFVGVAGISGFLLAAQARFYRSLVRADATLEIEQSVPRQYLKKGDQTPVLLDVTLDSATALEVTVDCGLPLVADVVAGEDSVVLERGETDASTSFLVEWPVVGRFAFEQATVRVTGPFGLFRESFPRGSRSTVTVEPRVPENVHVGKGGEEVIASYGGHRSDQLGSGTDPAELRQYVPGDSVSDIDWKATARLKYPHVREYEVETDRQTVLVLDRRASVGGGPSGETKFAYLREIALSFTSNAAEHNDPIGLATLDEGGTRQWEPPGTDPETYRRIETLLAELEPPEAGAGVAPDAIRGGDIHPASRVRRKAAILAGEDTPFAGELRPFFEETESYVQQMDARPLFGTVSAQLEEVSGAVWGVILTDDTDRGELREAVKLASQRASSVVVFITPTVLFESGGMADLDAAYDRYLEFEEFRRNLARLDRVAAFEVGPADRVETVLAAAGDRDRSGAD